MCTTNKNRFPATYVALPSIIEEQPHRVGFYLATEEYIARNFPEGSYLYSWVLPEPVAMIGRNQVLHQEVNLDFCKEQNIHLLRRKSGGGTIYGDSKNIFWSLITSDGSVEEIFAQYTQAIVDALKNIGIQAQISGRNDILLSDGKKICGNAFYRIGNRCIVHGTMLYDAELDKLLGALTPDKEKLKAAGVQSIRSRVGFLKEHTHYTILELRTALTKYLTKKQIQITEKDLAEIEKIEYLYYEEKRLHGHIINEGPVYSARIEGCGRIEIRFVLAGTYIKEVQLTGDFFENTDARQVFQQALNGVIFSKKDILDAITKHHPEEAVRGLSFESLTSLLELV